MTSISIYPFPILLTSTIETPINYDPFKSSSHDYIKIRSLSAVPILNYSFHTGVFPPPSITSVL